MDVCGKSDDSFRVHSVGVSHLRRTSRGDLIVRLFISKHFNSFSAGHLSGGRLRDFVHGNVTSAHFLTRSGTHALPSSSLCCGKNNTSLRLVSPGFSSVRPSSGIALTVGIYGRVVKGTPHVVSIGSSCDSRGSFGCVITDGNFRKRTSNSSFDLITDMDVGNRKSTHPRSC